MTISQIFQFFIVISLCSLNYSKTTAAYYDTIKKFTEHKNMHAIYALFCILLIVVLELVMGGPIQNSIKMIGKLPEIIGSGLQHYFKKFKMQPPKYDLFYNKVVQALKENKRLTQKILLLTMIVLFLLLAYGKNEKTKIA